MELKKYFILCEKQIPSKATKLRRISFTLRRNGITKMDELYQTMKNSPGQILELRDIGVRSMVIIKEVCALYEEGGLLLKKDQMSGRTTR